MTVQSLPRVPPKCVIGVPLRYEEGVVEHRCVCLLVDGSFTLFNQLVHLRPMQTISESEAPDEIDESTGFHLRPMGKGETVGRDPGGSDAERC